MVTRIAILGPHVCNMSRVGSGRTVERLPGAAVATAVLV
jgi:hypothetical protein